MKDRDKLPCLHVAERIKKSINWFAAAATAGRRAATTWEEMKETRWPRQHVTHDASTSGVAEKSGMRCSAGFRRNTKPKSPQRHGRKLRLSRQRVRNDAATSYSSGSTGSAISYTVHTTRQREVLRTTTGSLEIGTGGWIRSLVQSRSVFEAVT